MQRKKNPSAHEAFTVIKPCVLKAVGQSYYDKVRRRVHACICLQFTHGIYIYNAGHRFVTSYVAKFCFHTHPYKCWVIAVFISLVLDLKDLLQAIYIRCTLIRV